MTSRDEDYYRARAEEEREAASHARNAHVAEIHRELARAYEGLLDHPELRLVG